MHSRKSLKQLSIVWADDAAAIARAGSEAGRHFAQGCDLIDRLLEAVKQRDQLPSMDDFPLVRFD